MALKHVVLMVWTLGRGGAERMAFDLARSLPKRGYRTTLVAAGGGGELALEIRAAGVPLIICPDATRTSRLQTIAVLREQLRRLKPDLLHTHLGADVWGGWAAKREQIGPWLITGHSPEQGLSFLKRRLRFWAYHHADHVTAVSDAVAMALRRQYQLEEGRVSTVRLGVDLSRLPPRSDRGLGTPAKILLVGRLAPEKNQALLLQALAKVKRPWHLTIAGDGPEHPRLQSLVERLGLVPHVTFAGSVKDVSPLLREADLFCLPSFYEGQSLALLEAAASKVPALVSDLPAFREVFDRRSIAIVSSLQEDVWAEAITNTLEQYDAALERAEHAFDVVQRSFSLDSMADAYAELYRWMLPGRSSRSP